MKKDKEWLKRELIDIGNAPATGSDDYNEGFYKAFLEIESAVHQLDEPELPVIPQFVADEIERCKTEKTGLHDLIYCIENWVRDGWKVNDHIELIARAWLDGYEVEKEKLYKVTFLENRHVLTRRAAKKPLPYNFTVLWEYSDEINRLRAENPDVDKFTEQEIKAIDERYWAFAEEVTDNV